MKFITGRLVIGMTHFWTLEPKLHCHSSYRQYFVEGVCVLRGECLVPNMNYGKTGCNVTDFKNQK